MARLNHAGRGEVDAPIVDAGDAYGGTPAVTFGTSYVAGTASTLLRTDDQIVFPSALMSAANSSTLTLTDDATDQTLTGSLGILKFEGMSNQLELDWWNSAGGSAPSVGTVLGFQALSSVVGASLVNAVNLAISINDGGTHTSETHTGGIISAAAVSGTTFTSETLRGLAVLVPAVTFSSGTHSFTARTGLDISISGALQSGAGVITVTDTHGIRVSGYPTIGTGGTQTNARTARLQFPTIGATIRRGVSVETVTNNLGTEAANTEGFYCEDLTRGTAQRANYYAEGATTGTPTDVYAFYQGTAHVVGTNRYGARYTGATTGTPTLCVGVQVDAHAVGTTKYSFDGADPSHLNGIVMYDPSDIACGTTTGTKLGTGATEKVGFWGASPVVQSTGWTTSNVTSDKVLDANSYTTDELADVVCTIVDTLKTYGLMGA